jgi:hypothetical protein
MQASTLRVYSTKFAPLLSLSACQPVAAPGGRHSSRLYSSTDIAILSQAKELLSKGITYQQALEELLLSLPGASARTISPTSSTGAKSPQNTSVMMATSTEPVVKAAANALVAASLAHCERLAQEWQSLAEERAKESLQLRERIRELEDEIFQTEPRRNGWLARLFAAERQTKERQGSPQPVSPIWEI